MDNLAEMCFLCFNDSKLTNVPLDVKTTAQVKCIIPEFTNPKTSLHICRLCITMLQGFYKFKNMCLENYNRMIMFLDELEETSDTEDEKLEDDANSNIKEEIEYANINIKKEIEDVTVDIEEQTSFVFESILINENLPVADQCVSHADNVPECSSSTTMNNVRNRTPPDVEEAATLATFNVVPDKSKEKYECAYRRFMDYRRSKNIDSSEEDVVIAYFTDLGSKMKASTLWPNYSMLKSTLLINENIDIAKYQKLRAYLKRQSNGYTAKKSKILTKEQIQQFIVEASDDTFLATKVALIFGIAGACRRDELVRMNINDIEDLGSKLLITIPNHNTNKPRSFIINGMYLEKYRKYVTARPQNFNSTRFFFKYAMGKGRKQVIGINQIGKMPQIIATFLNLPNPKDYTGHCFRRSSGTKKI